MSDPLSITAGIVGIVVPALHGARLLLDDLEKIKDAPKTVASLTTDLAFFSSSLESIQGIEEPVWESIGASVAEQSRAAITSCGKACDTFRNDLRRWTKRSRDGQLSWRDRTSIGLFKERQIRALSEQMQSCKLTFNSVLGIATLYSSIHNSQMTEEIKRAMIVREEDVSAAVGATSDQLQVAARSLAEMQLADENLQDENEEEDLASAICQLKEQVLMLQSSQLLLQELRSNAQENFTEQATGSLQDHSIKVCFGNHNSGLQMGVNHGSINANFGRG